MGKNNRQRRAAKAKKRDRRRSDPPPGGEPGRYSERGRADDFGEAPPFGGPPTEEARITGLYRLNQLMRQHQRPDEVADATDSLARCSPALVARVIESDLARILPALWDGGWLPGEVIRQVKREISANGERLVAHAIAADHRDRPPSTLHPKWRLHVDQLSLPGGARPNGWLRSKELTESFTAGVEWRDLIDLASAVASALCGCGRLDEIIPPPGSSPAEQSIVDLSTQTAGPVLTKVRHLLAKAESTEFDAEADAFTAKAQELMARHAIDAAVVWDNQEQHDSPITIRIPLDDPYVNAKSLLVAVVAEASQCRAVFHPRYAMASLVGFDSDLVWCETLYTSLLVQAQRELTRAGAADRAGGRRRSRSFRSSFLTSYAHRIGERLAEVNAHVRDAPVARGGPATLFDEADAPSGSTLLPVLARRRSVVDDAVSARFGELTDGPRRSVNDLQGWSAGRQAADRAQLNRGDIAASQAS